jgi:lipid-binding SYLF domain-containing protein
MTQSILHTLNTSSSTRLSPNGTHSGLDFTIQNSNETGYIYLGGDSSVSSTNYGFRILPNHSISFELPGKDAIYAISSANGMKAAVIYTSLEF